MSIELEKAQVMFKLTRKNNWNACYDRLEHFKRFNNLDSIIKDLVKLGWVILHKKPNYQAISLNSQYKKEIIEFIELNMPHLKGLIK
jgi:hypothetical protein